MANLTVVDLVRDDTLVVEVDLTATTAEVLEEVVAVSGLPRRTAGGRALHYELRAPDEETALAPEATVDRLRADHLVLSSPDAGPTWARVHALAVALRREVRRDVDQLAEDARTEVTGSVDRLREDAREEVRSLVRDITADLEAEARRWIKRTGKRMSLWTRRRVRRQIDELARTGALPREVAALREASGHLTVAARSAMVLPAAAAAVAATVVAGAAVTTTVMADNRADEALALAQQALEAAGVAQVSADGAQVAADDAQVSADEAQVTAQRVGSRLGEHVEGHDELVLGAVDAQVRQALGPDPPDTLTNAGWITTVLGTSARLADGRIDLHRSTTFRVERERVPVQPGDSLWSVARAALSGAPDYAHGCPESPPDPAPSIGEVANYVTDLWSANTGLVGPDFSTLEVGTLLQIPCPR